MTLPHAAVETPVFMPVGTVATVKAVPQHLLEEMEVRLLLGKPTICICGLDMRRFGGWAGCTAL